jgi:superfamily I DNA/RNA helicase
VARRVVAHLGVTDLAGGGSSAHDGEALPGLGLADVAVLFRLRRQGRELAQAFDAVGLPWQMAGEEEITAADELDLTADKINLLTMHAAKGLEFRLVFVVGLEEGLCPFLPDDRVSEGGAWRERSSDSEDRLVPFKEPPVRRRERDPEEELREERRLFYVAVTRAKERLYLTRAEGRILYGRALSGRPSSFWALAPEDVSLDWRDSRRRPPRLRTARLF